MCEVNIFSLCLFPVAHNYEQFFCVVLWIRLALLVAALFSVAFRSRSKLASRAIILEFLTARANVKKSYPVVSLRVESLPEGK